MIGGTLTGQLAVQAKLRTLKQAMQNRITRKAVAAGTKVLMRAMKAAAPVGTGTYGGLLRKSIGRRVKVYRFTNIVVGITGPRFRMGVPVGGRTRRGKQRMLYPTTQAIHAERRTGFASGAMASASARAAAAVQETLTTEIAKL